jgi:hypothetical protein
MSGLNPRHKDSEKGNLLKTLQTILVILGAAALVGCGGLTKGKAAAEAAIARFHASYNQGKLDDIWKEADPGFRTASAKQNYDDLMGAVQRKLGKVTSTSNTGWNVQSFNFKTTVSMTQKSVFESGQGTESFTFTVDGTNAVLTGYNIQSMDLITK